MRLPYEVFVVVRRGEEFLILHRSPPHGAYWHCVAGGIEPGETSAEAAARELLEETGLEASLLELERTWVYDLEAWEPRYEPGTSSVTVECFLAEAPDRWEPTLDWEHDDYRWCDAMAAVELLHWPEPRELLQEIGSR